MLYDWLIDHTTRRSVDRSQSNKSPIPKKLLVNVCPLERIDAMRSFCLPWQLVFFVFLIWNPLQNDMMVKGAIGGRMGVPPHTFGIHRLTLPPHVDKVPFSNDFNAIPSFFSVLVKQ